MHLQRRPTFDHESVRNGAKLSQTAQPTIEVTGDDGPGLRWLFDILVHDRAEAARGAARPQDHERQTLTELAAVPRSEEHTSELQSLMRISYAVFCLKKKTHNMHQHI